MKQKAILVPIGAAFKKAPVGNAAATQDKRLVAFGARAEQHQAVFVLQLFADAEKKVVSQTIDVK